MVELNIIEQCINIFKIGFVQRHQAKYGFPRIHGVVYNIKDGQLKELEVDYQMYVKKYSSIYRLHSFTTKMPTALTRTQLQANAIKEIGEAQGDEGRLNLKLLKRAMLNEPLLFSASETEEAIKFASQGEDGSKEVDLLQVSAYFEGQGTSNAQ